MTLGTKVKVKKGVKISTLELRLCFFFMLNSTEHKISTAHKY